MAHKQPRQIRNGEAVIKPTSEGFQKKLVGQFSEHRNVGGRVLTVLESDIRICLMTHLECIRERGAWQVPLGIFLTVLITLLTVDFRNVFGLTKEVWQAIFIVSAVISLVWLIVSLFRIPKKMTINDIIDKLMAPPIKTEPKKD